MDLLPHLLPLGSSLQVNQLLIESDGEGVTIILEAIAPDCPCPSCQSPASRIHSHYQRTLADLPWANLVVRLHLLVRKFFCDNAACRRKIFTERLPNLVAPSARRTLRLMQQQQQLGLALGGNPGARLSSELDRGASRNTLLRLVRRLPLPEPQASEVVGIDDWAWKKGQRYGTIMTDLERQGPLALLEDRDAETLAAWFKRHPTIRIIARDRVGTYAEAATKGAPQAIQVADRFHVLGNLADTLLPLREAHPDLEEAINLTEDFASLVRTHDPQALDRWLEQAATSTLKPFQSFAASLRRDYDAVRAGVELPWSTGPVEGEINRLKMLKRAMFGRASFPLLQRRVLLAG